MKVTVHKAGETLVVALPDQIVARLGWSSGDLISLEIEGDDLKLVRVQQDHDRTMEIADEVIEEYRSVFEQLAKT